MAGRSFFALIEVNGALRLERPEREHQSR